MAKVIDFYILDRFPKKLAIASTEPGRVLQFRLLSGKAFRKPSRHPALVDSGTTTGSAPHKEL